MQHSMLNLQGCFKKEKGMKPRAQQLNEKETRPQIIKDWLYP